MGKVERQPLPPRLCPLKKLALVNDVPVGKTKFVCVRDTLVILANWDRRIYVTLSMAQPCGII